MLSFELRVSGFEQNPVTSFELERGTRDPKHETVHS